MGLLDGGAHGCTSARSNCSALPFSDERAYPTTFGAPIFRAN